MIYDYKILLQKFIDISSRGWIKGVNNHYNSVGLTFESELDKKSDSMYFPDYKGIEIKCSQRYSRYPIGLFSLAFDGPNLYQMNEILQKYGKPDKTYENRKILMSRLSAKDKILVNDKYYFKLEISNEAQKLYLSIYDINGNLLEREAYIEFQTIKQRLELKLSMLAMVWASKRVIDGILSFRYYKIIIYKLTSFENFIDLLSQDIIKVSIIGRVSRSGEEAGRQRNKNLVFSLPKENIEQLFDTVEKRDIDSELKFQIL